MPDTFIHGDDEALYMPAGTRVLLTVPLDRDPGLEAVDAYVWIDKNCGHTDPIGDAMDPQFPATLRDRTPFTCMQVCRGDGAGVEALYQTVVPGNRLAP